VGETTPFAVLAHAFLPADPSVAGVVVEAPVGRDGLTIPEHADVVVWGRLADGAPHAPRRVAARELDLLALRATAPARLRLSAVHRLHAPGARAGLRGWARGVVRAGVVVELVSPRAGPRVLDAVLHAAGGAPERRRIRAGAGGTLLLRVRLEGSTQAVLRVARAAAPGDPATAADTLERLAGVAFAPRLLGRGVVAGASWSAEEALPGRRPGALTSDLAHQVASACATLPRCVAPPTAPVDDLLGVAARLPWLAGDLRRLADLLRPRLDGIPAIERHGDLWAGNLLVDGGALCGIVDWDAAHRHGVPGGDLVQLVGTDLRRRARRSLGRAVLERPWRSGAFAAATAGYWRAVGVSPAAALLDTAGVAWWDTEIHGTLLRFPQRATDPRWVAENVASALPELTRRVEAPSGRSHACARGSTRRAAMRG
jgi:hypothetical protein